MFARAARPFVQRHGASRGMATLKELQMKIDSTKGIEKITKSMKMVSAAKLRGDQTRLEVGTAFGKSVDSMLPKSQGAEAMEETGGYVPDYESEKSCVLVISSDRGLCGGVNSQVAKLAKAVARDGDNIAIVGEKARGALTRTNGEQIFLSMDEMWKPPMNFTKASMIAHRILASGQDFDDVKVLFNVFKSVVAFEPTVQAVKLFSKSSDPAEMPAELKDYELEPEVPAEVLMNLTEHILATKILYASLENATSEQSARMNAMENASKNAAEMIETLTIKYNRARQAKITTELIEIISGAESLNA